MHKRSLRRASFFPLWDSGIIEDQEAPLFAFASFTAIQHSEKSCLTKHGGCHWTSAIQDSVQLVKIDRAHITMFTETLTIDFARESTYCT